MPGRGFAPKPDGEVRRRNARPPVTVVAADGEVRGPDLPDSHEWPAATLRWWQTWRESPQAQQFSGTDWDFLLDTALLHAEFWLGNLAVEAGLRLRVAKFGATVEDRTRLRMAIGEPASTMAAPVSRKATSQRQRLLKAVK